MFLNLRWTNFAQVRSEKIDCSCWANCDDSNFFVQAYVNTIYMLNMFAFASEYGFHFWCILYVCILVYRCIHFSCGIVGRIASYCLSLNRNCFIYWCLLFGFSSPYECSSLTQCASISYIVCAVCFIFTHHSIVLLVSFC